MDNKAKSLTYEMIISSREISNWLNQFEIADRNTALALLQRLKFISRDVYSNWLRSTMEQSNDGNS